MRGRSLSKQETREGKLKEEPHLSGAYIRCLVKQLTSSRTKDPMNPKDRGCLGDSGFSGQNMIKSGEVSSENQETQQPQQHKKQVRRRLHTTKPYQQRLLNMAEARREIVAALKFHRASMKQAKEQQQQQQDHRQQPSPPVQLSAQPCFEQEGKIKSRRNPRIYPSNTANFSNYLDTLSCTSNFSHTPPPSYPFCWSTSPNLPSTFIDEHLNFPLPNQTLGLNLNFQDFNDLDTTLYQSSNNPSLVYSSSSPSSFSSPSPSPSLSIITQEIPSVGKSQEGLPPAVSDSTETYGGGGLHQVMDDEEMAEIRSIGEQHQMEWNDTMNWVTSAWWFKFLKTMEPNQEVKTEDDNYHPFDQVIEFPAWLDSNDECLQQQFADYCIQDYYHDPALPCMDIGDIEGIDGEWLA